MEAVVDPANMERAWNWGGWLLLATAYPWRR
jgi:hypothetical protein